VFFVTSEQPIGGAARRYTVRLFDPETSVCHTAEPGTFYTMTKAQAIKRAKALAAGAANLPPEVAEATMEPDPDLLVGEDLQEAVVRDLPSTDEP
jgi:hypothetical protein